MTLTGRFVIRALSAAFAANVVLAACATPPADDPEARAELAAINDPWEPFNRAVFEFNRAVDQVLFEPVAQAYRGVVPDFGREMVKNFLNNLRSPVILANDVLQGEKDRAGDTGSRLMANTIFGLGGLFDITEKFGSRGRSKTLRSRVTIRDGLEWLADTKRIAKHEIPQRERSLMDDLTRERQRGPGR